MRFVLLSIFLSSSIALFGQLNFKVGYDLAYNRPGELNKIIDQYNEEANANPNIMLESEMGKLRFTGGLELGLRYSIGNTSFEFSLSSMSKTHVASGIGISSDTLVGEFEVREALNYSFNRYSLGYQYQIGSFGYGASIGRRKVRVRTEVDGTDVKLTLTEKSNYAAKVYMLYDLPGLKSMRMSLIPYVEFPLGDMNVANVGKRILQNPTGGDDIRESFPVFGLSFVFYNGPRRR